MKHFVIQDPRLAGAGDLLRLRLPSSSAAATPTSLPTRPCPSYAGADADIDVLLHLTGAGDAWHPTTTTDRTPLS